MNAYGPALERATEADWVRLIQTASYYGFGETPSREEVRGWQTRSVMRWRMFRERFRKTEDRVSYR